MANPDETIPHEAAVKDVVDAEIDRVGGGGSDLSSLVTTKGDLLVATGAGALERLGVALDGTVLTAQSSQDSGMEWLPPASPPPPPGVPVIRRFPFAHFTPDLLTGFGVYIPTIGDLLLDAWLEIDTAWDGTTPTGDFGYFDWFNLGLLAHINEPVDMTIPDTSGLGSEWTAPLLSQQNGHQPSSMMAAFLKVNTHTRGLPVKFTSTDMIKVVVSQDGKNNGADPGSTQGAAALYLVTCTPLST